MSRRVLLAGGVLTAILLVVGCVLFSIYYIDNKMANFSRQEVLYVYPEMSSQDVLQVLDSVVCKPRSLARCFRKEDVASKIKPGRYVVKPEHSSVYVARMLNFGWQTPQNLTLSGTIRNKGVLAKKISFSCSE